MPCALPQYAIWCLPIIHRYRWIMIYWSSYYIIIWQLPLHNINIPMPYNPMSCALIHHAIVFHVERLRHNPSRIPHMQICTEQAHRYTPDFAAFPPAFAYPKPKSPSFYRPVAVQNPRQAAQPRRWGAEGRGFLRPEHPIAARRASFARLDLTPYQHSGRPLCAAPEASEADLGGVPSRPLWGRR